MERPSRARRRRSAPPMTLVIAVAALTLAVARAPARADGGPGTVTRVDVRALPVGLVSPSTTAPLAAGSTVELAWNVAPPAAVPAWVDEWEAFLSLDGGRTFPFRLTPHLDLDVR